MKVKKFDCVELMHQGAEKIQGKTSVMTREEEVTFWRERSRILRERQKASQGKGPSAKHGESRSESDIRR